MEIEYYVSLPTVIKAWRVDMDSDQPEWVRQAVLNRELVLEGDPVMKFKVFDKEHGSYIPFKEGDWIICGLKEELYPCVDDVFRVKYRRYINEDSDASPGLSFSQLPDTRASSPKA